MWEYHQGTGTLLHDGKFEGSGYSGTGTGRNNPAAQAEQAVGPIPQGHYKIGGAYQHPHLGPCVMNLDPAPDTDTLGRGDFRIHGNNQANDASHGCIILGPVQRRFIAESDDRVLNVVA